MSTKPLLLFYYPYKKKKAGECSQYHFKNKIANKATKNLVKRIVIEK